jgi:alpha-glucosidase (family GH31 glycosyl hydrolase)
MRPLWFEYPDDQRTYTVEGEYLVGRDLLVAPVVTESATKRGVYFPAGDNWVDWWTGKTYQGGRDAEIEAPLDRLPLFARAGSVIPTQEVVQHTGEMSPKTPLTLVAVYGAPPALRSSVASRLYEDGGEGYGYLRGASLTTTFTHSDTRVVLSREGSYAGGRPLAALEYIGLPWRPRSISFDGRASDAEASYDPATLKLHIPLPASNFKEVSVEPR